MPVLSALEALSSYLHFTQNSVWHRFIPPSTTLLSELLGIPVYANLINEFLERATYQGLRLHVPGDPNPNVAYKEAIVTNLAVLDQKCQKCEQEFEKLFGHLGEL